MHKQKFYKSQCNGNDFILIIKNDLHIELDEPNIQKFCNRKKGVGADGLILIDTSIESDDFKMDYYNCDGSWETMCANGALCSVLLLQSLTFEFKTNTFLAGDGQHKINLINNKINISMKPPSNVTDELEVNGFSGKHIDSGAKHFVTLSKELDQNILYDNAQSIRYSSTFKPSGLNVNFLSVESDNHIHVITYEKGIEQIMRSCGSGSVAAAYYASQSHQLISPLHISNIGGKMELTFNKEWTEVWLNSHPVILFESYVDLDLVTLD